MRCFLNAQQPVFGTLVCIKMKRLNKIFSLKTKKYTQSRGDKKNIVVSGYRWVFVQRFELTPDLQGDELSFLANIRAKDYYYEDVAFTWPNSDEVINKRYHGPYLIDSLSASDYVRVEVGEMKRIFEDTLQDEEFNNGFPFNEQFKLEAEELISSVIRPNSEIFWLNKKYDRSDSYGRYEYWAEFIIRNKNEGELAYITFSED